MTTIEFRRVDEKLLVGGNQIDGGFDCGERLLIRDGVGSPG